MTTKSEQEKHDQEKRDQEKRDQDKREQEKREQEKRDKDKAEPPTTFAPPDKGRKQDVLVDEKDKSDLATPPEKKKKGW